MKQRIYLFLFLALLINYQMSYGSCLSDSLKIIPATSLRKDLLILKDSLFKIHPDLYRYKDKKTIDNLFGNYYANLKSDKSEIQFYADIKYLLSSIQDGHLYSWSDRCYKYYNEKAKLFPLQLKFISGKAYIYCNNTTLENGAEVLAINGKSIEIIRDELFQYITSDGAILTNKNYELSDNFSLYYLMVYGYQSPFKVSFKRKSNKIDTLTIPAEYKQNISCKKTDEARKNLLNVDFKDNDRIGILTIKTFSYQEIIKSKKDYHLFLDSTFKELKTRKTNKLIIDLRSNGGGRDTYGALLYSFLTNKEFSYYASLETSTRKLTSLDHPNLLIQKHHINNFNGKVFFLINGLSFSTTAEFCSVAKSNKRGLFIGEETGGGYWGNNSGSFKEVTLPNSQIKIYIPTVKYVMAVNTCTFNNRGVIPDYEIIPSIDDILNQVDIQLNFALKMAKNNN